MLRLKFESLEDRLTPAAGVLDQGFGTNGVAGVSQLSSILDAKLLNDGRVVAVGSDGNDFGVARLTAAGQPDPTFGTNGFTSIPFNLLSTGDGNDVAYSVTAFQDGSGYVIVGIADVPSPDYFSGYANGIAIAVLAADGKLDPHFDADGKFAFQFVSGSESFSPTVNVRPDRTIQIGGQSSSPNGASGGSAVRVFRHNVLDGWETTDRSFFIANAIELQTLSTPAFAPDGGFYLTTTTDSYNEGDAAILGQVHRKIVQERYALSLDESDYVRDASFSSGTGTLLIGEFDGSPSKYDRAIPSANVQVGEDGWPLVGFFTGGFITSRYNGTNAYTFNGLPDADFGTGGVSTTVPYATGGFDRLADGREYVMTTGSLTTTYGDTPANRLARRSRNGAADANFGQNGSVDLSNLKFQPTGTTRPFDSRFNAVGLDATADGGSIVFGSNIVIDSNSAIQTVFFLARYLGDTPTPPAIAALSNETVTSGLNDNLVRVLASRAAPVDTVVVPFQSDSTDARPASADFNGDGVLDAVVGTGTGTTARFQGIDRTNGTTLFQANPFEDFTGGVFLTTGDLDGDGRPELIVTPDRGGGPRVVVYKYDPSVAGGLRVIDSFFGIDDPNFRGGARAAIGDVNGDGQNDVAVAAGFGGGPRVAVYDGSGIGKVQKNRLFNDFFAFEPTLLNGVYVTVGDMDGDGFAEVICGGGPGGGPRVTAYSGQNLLMNQYEAVANYFAGDESARDGVRLIVKNLDNDAKADLVTSSGTTVRSYRAIELPRIDFALENAGVYVG